MRESRESEAASVQPSWEDVAARCARRRVQLGSVRKRLSSLRTTTTSLPTLAWDDMDAADELMSVLAEVEAAKAWLDHLSVHAAGALLVWSEMRTRRDLDMYGATAAERALAMTHARTSIVDEIILATGLGQRDATARAEIGALSVREPERTATALAGLHQGRIGWFGCRRLVSDCLPLPADQADEVARMVLAPTRDGAAPSGRLLADRTSRQLKKRICGRERRRAALDNRTSEVDLGDDDTGTLRITGATPRVVAAQDRLHRMARRLRSLGDQRTVAQLRSDIGLDLLLHGHTAPLCGVAAAERDDVDPATGPHGTMAPPAGATSSWEPDLAESDSSRSRGQTDPVDATDHADAAEQVGATDQAEAADAAREGRPTPPAGSVVSWVTATSTDSEAASVGAESPPSRTPAGASAGPRQAPPSPATCGDCTSAALRLAYPGNLPAAHVTVTISAAALLGITRDPGEVAGAGYAEAELVRELALAAGSVWSRLVTDPLTGTAVELSTPAYRPTAAISRAVRARDHRCRAPGCLQPEDRCDLDHATPYAEGGPTSVANLLCDHGRHHGHHTSGHWSVAAEGEAFVWRMQTGRRYATEPYQYAEPDSDRPEISRIEGLLMGRVIAFDVTRVAHHRGRKQALRVEPAQGGEERTDGDRSTDARERAAIGTDDANGLDDATGIDDATSTDEAHDARAADADADADATNGIDDARAAADARAADACAAAGAQDAHGADPTSRHQALRRASHEERTRLPGESTRRPDMPGPPPF